MWAICSFRIAVKIVLMKHIVSFLDQSKFPHQNAKFSNEVKMEMEYTLTILQK